MSIIGIIPARYSSSRFPGKPLVEINGKTMLQRVYEQTKKANLLNDVIIATDDERIEAHAKSFGANVIITNPNHQSGTDRCFEAYLLNNKPFDYVINIQGDEPFIDPIQIDSLAQFCNGETEIATQMIKCKSHDILFDKGEVKIVLNHQQEALLFSRNVIPHIKGKKESEWHNCYNYYRHIGMYAYHVKTLEQITKLEPSALEIAESLEQLRWLEHGFKIKCIETEFDSHCIDTFEDIEKVLRLMNIK